MADKIRENRVRRRADRAGLQLVKSRSRDPKAVDYGVYALMNIQAGGAINPAIANRWVCSWSLDQVEDYLAN